MNENYTVKLQFSEIIFTDDNSLYSIGNRLFDVYIQTCIELYVQTCLLIITCDESVYIGKVGSERI